MNSTLMLEQSHLLNFPEHHRLRLDFLSLHQAGLLTAFCGSRGVAKTLGWSVMKAFCFHYDPVNARSPFACAPTKPHGASLLTVTWSANTRP